MKLTKTQLRELLKNEIKADEIVKYLAYWGIDINDREWRTFVRNFNDKYAKSGLYIASSKKGYILTTKKNLIKKSAFNKFKTGLSMMKNAKATIEELQDHNQLSLLDEEELTIYNILKAFE